MKLPRKKRRQQIPAAVLLISAETPASLFFIFGSHFQQIEIIPGAWQQTRAREIVSRHP